MPPGRDTISAGEIVQHQVNFVEADMREVQTAWGKSQAASAVAIRVPAKSKDPEAQADCRRDVPSEQPILVKFPGIWRGVFKAIWHAPCKCAFCVLIMKIS
jgi:hypothetical protein